MRASRTARTGQFQVPRIAPLELPSLEERVATDLRAGAEHELSQFSEIDISGEDFSGTTFVECAFDGVSAYDTKLVGARCIETRFTRINAPVLKAARTTWRDVEVLSSRLGAVEMFDAELSQVVVEGSKLGWLNLRSSNLHDVVFRDCKIEELDLTDASLRRVAFENCTVDMLVLRGAQAEHVDLCGLEFAGIQGIEGLRGSRVTEGQALDLMGVFAAHFGIEVTAG